MGFLNYTTEVSTDKTLTEIQRLLAAAHCQAVMNEMHEGVVTAISFRIVTRFGLMSFRLPGNVEKVQVVLERSKLERRFRTKEQAARVAWRVVKDWLEAQLAIIKAEMVTLEQAFLPYAQDSSGVTVYEKLAGENFKTLALPAPK